MKHRQTDISLPAMATLARMKSLPRPVFGHAQGVANLPVDRAHRHPWVQLSYAVRGVLEVRTEEGRFVAPPLYAIWIPAGLRHAVRCTAETELGSLYMDAAVAPLAHARCRVLAVSPLLRELIRAFGELPVEYDEQGAEGRLAAVLIDQLACAPEMGLMLPWPKDARLRRVCTEIQAAVGNRRGLSHYSARLQLSEKTLSRLFLEQTGLTFRLWRQRARILAAMPLLERGDRVTDVALACGYESMSAFIAAFREQVGATPREVFAAAAG